MCRPATLLVAAALTLGCSEVAPPGGLDVSWRIGALGCTEAGVDKVFVELYDFYDGTGQPSILDVLPCSEEGTTIENIASGEYTLLLRGVDTNECWTHEARDEVYVQSGSVEIVDPLPLLRRQRPLLIRWPFENERDCFINEVEQVRVIVEVDDRYSEEFFFLCQGLGKELPAEVPLGDVTVRVWGLDVRGRPLALGVASKAASAFTANACDDEVEVRVPLALCETAECVDG